MREDLIQFDANGQPGSGFLVRPESDGPTLAVVVIQEWWGLNEHIKDVARRYAKAGYVALAPDLYHGKVVSEPTLAQKEVMALDRPRAVQEILGAVAYLKAQSYVAPKKIGVTGFCMGGGLTLAATTVSTEIGAAVPYYGGGAPDAEAFKNNKTPILNIIGEKDEWVLGSVQKIAEGVAGMGVPFEIVVYPGAQHAFFNDTRPEVYDAVASKDAWERTLAWFEKYLV